jgi:hypothetical protein
MKMYCGCTQPRHGCGDIGPAVGNVILRALCLLIQGSGIYVYRGSPTIVINGRGRGDVASKRLDDDLRPFTSSVELKVVNFAGN